MSGYSTADYQSSEAHHRAGATTLQGIPCKEFCRLITEAGRIPVERDTLYNTVTRTEDSFIVAA